jgi:outer membrane protein assembly factor BamB
VAGAASAARNATACALPARAAPSAGNGAAWRVALAEGTGGFTLGAGDGIVVAGGTGAGVMSYDAATGAPCAVLADDGAASAIDRYTDRSRIAHGMLIGAKGLAVSAVDLRSGRQRWTREVAAGSSDDTALRDALIVRATASAVIIGFRVAASGANATRNDEIVAALDPATGAERWRVTASAHLSSDPRPPGGWLGVATDAGGVYLRTSGAITAIDAATGAQRWVAKWPALPPVIGPQPTGPVIASDGASVALGVPGRLRTFDARTGAARGELALTGEPVQLVARPGAFYAAVEAAPGSASVVAIDAAAPRVLWTHPAAYSVRQVRADADLIYVIDGNGRITALDPATARPRFSVNAGARDVAIVRAPGGAPRLVVPHQLDSDGSGTFDESGASGGGPSGASGGGPTGASGGGPSLVAFDPQAMAPPLAPFARWEIVAEPGGLCRLDALAWVDGADRVVWRRTVPGQRRQAFRSLCEDVQGYRRSPRDAAGKVAGVLGIVDAGAAIVMADELGALALRKADGAIVLTTEASIDDRALRFDDGTFAVAGLPNCRGPAPHARVLARCGNRLVYFNGTTALILALDTLRVDGRGTFGRDATWQSGGHGAHQVASIKAGGYVVTLEGMTYMR